MKVQLKISNSAKHSCTVIFISQGANKKSPMNIYSKDPDIKKTLLSGAEDKIFEGKQNEAYFFRNINTGVAKHVLAIGLGPLAKADFESVRRSVAAGLKTLKANKIEEAVVRIGQSFPKSLSGPSLMRAISESLVMSSYSFDELKSDKKEEKTIHIEIVFEGKAPGKTSDEGLREGVIIGESVNFARRLGDLPGNLMTPSILAKETVHAAKGTKLKVNVWDLDKIKKEKMGCLAGVSAGSSEDAKFIVMEYKGGTASKKPICYVGKGLTFDSGGISIKPAAGMEEMKYDMCGGAATIATMLAIARLKLKVNAIGIVPSSENMPGPAATKPGDIHYARNGKSVEINNTDAEGRLILADALSYATELKPAFIVDSATLTGAMVIALGDLHTGYFTRNKKLAKKLQDASEESGELMWQLPLVDEHGEDMKGTYADLSNISSNKGAGSAHGAAFLEFFVDSDIPWAHVDIAGTAYHTGHRVPYNPKRGGSGVMVRTYIELAKIWS